jgi:hypothetical protein
LGSGAQPICNKSNDAEHPFSFPLLTIAATPMHQSIIFLFV